MPGLIGPEADRKRGYKLADFREAFDRYLEHSSKGHPSVCSQPFSRSERDMGTSHVSQPFNPDPGCTVAECKKPNNDGVLNGCTVTEDSRGEKSIEPGLRQPELREHAHWYVEEADRRRVGGNLDQDALDRDLRRLLAERGVLPEFISVEFERVMKAVFAAPSTDEWKHTLPDPKPKDRAP